MASPRLTAAVPLGLDDDSAARYQLDTAKLKEPSDQDVHVEIQESSSSTGKNDRNGAPLIATVDNEGPIVTRKELWAYYRKSEKKNKEQRALTMIRSSLL